MGKRFDPHAFLAEPDEPAFDAYALTGRQRPTKDQTAANVLLGRKKKSPAEIETEAKRLQSPVDNFSWRDIPGAGVVSKAASGLLAFPGQLARGTADAVIHPVATMRQLSALGMGAPTAEEIQNLGGSDVRGQPNIQDEEAMRRAAQRRHQMAADDKLAPAAHGLGGGLGMALMAPVLGPAAVPGMAYLQSRGEGNDSGTALEDSAAAMLAGKTVEVGGKAATPVVRGLADKAIKAATPNAAEAIKLGAKYDAAPKFGRGLRGGPFDPGGELHGVKPSDMEVGRIADEQASLVDNKIRDSVQREGASVGAEEARARALVTGPRAPIDGLRARLQRLSDQRKPGPWAPLIAHLDEISHNPVEPGPAEPAVSPTADTVVAGEPEPVGAERARRPTAITQALPISERAGQRAPGATSKLASLEDLDTFIEAIDAADPFKQKITKVKDRNIQNVRALANAARGAIDHPVAQDLADARTRYHQAKKDASLQRNAMGQRIEADDTGTARSGLAGKMIRMGTGSAAEGKQASAVDLLRLYGHDRHLDMPELLRRQGQIRPGLALNPITLAAKNANAFAARVVHPLSRNVGRPAPSLATAAAAQVARERKRRP